MDGLFGASKKNRSISRDASGPCSSVNDPSGLPPDQAWPSPSIAQTFRLGNAARVCDDGARVSAPARDAVMPALACGIGEAGANVGEDRLGVGRIDVLSFAP